MHVLLFSTALLMWMPVLSPIVEIRRLSYPAQMLYLFAQSIVPTVPASFLTFGDGPLYRVYEDLPRLWGISAIADQRMAGLVMKILGGLILWAVIAVLFFRWAKLHEETGTDEESWREVERALGHKIDYFIPSDYRLFSGAANHGMPIGKFRAGSGAEKQIARMATAAIEQRSDGR